MSIFYLAAEGGEHAINPLIPVWQEIVLGIVFAAYIQSTARQPESAGLTRTYMFLGFVLVEALALLGLALAFVFQKG